MTDEQTKDEFLGILEKNIRIIIKIARAYTKIKEDHEDLINDITLQLWKSYGQFRGNSQLSTWIYRVSLNTSMNYKRNRGKDSLNASFSDLTEKNWLYVDDDDLPQMEILYECIDCLDEINKAIILLYLDGNSHAEISEVTGISKTNVGTRIGRIKEQLKSLITSKNQLQ